MASQEQLRLQQQMAMAARQQQMQMMAAMQQQRQREAAANGSQQNAPMRQQMQPQFGVMGSTYDDVPVLQPSDIELLKPHPVELNEFQSACKHGPLSIIESTVASGTCTPAVLHNGLTLALSAGNVEGARRLLASGAPIVRQTPNNVLSAPQDKQIALFELLTEHGWTPNTPGFYGAVLLPKIVTNLPLLTWFLANGANPNLGPQRDNRDRTGGSETDSCTALEAAAAHGSAEAVKLLLDADARIQNGTPLHSAAGTCPPGANPHAGRVAPNKEFDQERIPVMELLVERGADVNQKKQSRHMEAQYPIVYATMAGAVERVRWLLARGADPYAKGPYGNAVEYANLIGSDEMKSVIEEGAAAMR